MSDALAAYRTLESDLVRIRWIHRGLESSEEDDVLEKMDGAWAGLSDAEQALVSAEPTRSLLREGSPCTRTMMDVDVWIYRDLPPRSLEVA